MKIILVILGVLAVWMGSARAETGFLGLEVQGFDKKVAKILDQKGILVKNVAIGEAGAIAGFRRGDLIIEFNRIKISNFDALLKGVLKTKPGQRIPVTGKRNGCTVKLNLQSGKRPAS
ncbi:MAG: PDZ domain-containing protein [Rhodospirillales bacterium]|jgi:S1-C subfamily serine protease|nr:PDZ domain-containing protein [Rhodospirillales bacterium]HJO86522.1 PDZ domain-containing protein [Rhodospirillales bacterium]